MTKNKNAALALYRSILKAHQKHLPREMRQLGDSYVKAEFKLHKTVKDSSQLDSFFNEWELYLEQILKAARIKESSVSLGEDSMTATFGHHLPSDVSLSEEQSVQLEKLKEEASKAGRPR